jgi:hypothetical protein
MTDIWIETANPDREPRCLGWARWVTEVRIHLAPDDDVPRHSGGILLDRFEVTVDHKGTPSCDVHVRSRRLRAVWDSALGGLGKYEAIESV